MTDKELVNHYKSLFMKSKKLIIHYEEELNQLKNNVTNLKNKLKEYESGKYFSIILYQKKECHVKSYSDLNTINLVFIFSEMKIEM